MRQEYDRNLSLFTKKIFELVENEYCLRLTALSINFHFNKNNTSYIRLILLYPSLGDSLNAIKSMKPFSIIILLLALISASFPAQAVSDPTLDQVVLPEVAFNGLELSKVAYVLSSFSRIYSDDRREIQIRVQASSEGELYDIPVTYSAKNISLRRVIEDIAAQTNSEVKYLSDSSVVFTDPPNRLTLEQKAKQVRELNPNWNTHLSDPELLMAYLRYHPHEIKTFNAPATMKSRLEAALKEAKLQEEVARKAKVQEEARKAKQQQEEARRAISNNTQSGPTSNNQSAPRVKTNPSSISDDDDIIGLMIVFVIGATTWGAIALGKRNNTAVTKPKRTQKSTAQKTPTRKTPTAQKRPPPKLPTKKATTKKRVASKSTTKTASGSHINDESHNPGNSGGIEAQISHLQQLFDRGQISEAEMDKKIRKILTGSS
jgi:hypothetical protein